MGLKKSEIFVLSERYAKALYATAGDVDVAKSISNQLGDILSLIGESDYLGRIFEKNSIDKKNIKVLTDTLKEKANISDKLINFILLLNDNGRLFLISEVASKLAEIIREQDGILVADIYTATKLSENYTKKVKDALKSSFNKEVQIKEVLDKSILGGLKIKIGSTLFDDSIASKITKLKLKFENN